VEDHYVKKACLQADMEARDKAAAAKTVAEKARQAADHEKAAAERARLKAEHEGVEKAAKERERAAAERAKAEKEAAEKLAKDREAQLINQMAEKHLSLQDQIKAQQLEQEKELESRRKKLGSMDAAQRKKEEELLRVAEKAKTIDFETIGLASKSQKDDLQQISGIGPFCEDKLNMLGIYTFLQLSKMTAKVEEKVNVAIEFFQGRVRRDEWAKQAKQFVKEQKKSDAITPRPVGRPSVGGRATTPLSSPRPSKQMKVET